MLQAAVFDCLFLDPFPLSENGSVAPEVDVGRCDVVQALVVTLVVITIDECPDLSFQIAGKVIVFQQHTVLHRLMPAFDFALGLRMEWSTTDMIHILPFQPFGQVARYVVSVRLSRSTAIICVTVTRFSGGS